MIHLTRLNGDAFALNCDLIERVDAHPDTVVTLVDDTKYVVRDSVEDVIDAIVNFRARIFAVAGTLTAPAQAARGDLSVVPPLKEK